MKFEYKLHNQILEVLRSLNSAFLSDCHTCFGGGTLLTLNYGEYRLSRDIDFLCNYGDDYSRLRVVVYEQGYDALFKPNHPLFQLPSEIRADQYGIRFPILIDNQTLKFEIISEGRINLEMPSYPEWSPVACLNWVDQIAEKLLANSDRWADRSTDARDLIDLAILRSVDTFPEVAISKAEAVYQVIAPLKRAIQSFQNQPDYRHRCYERLSINNPARVINGLDELANQFDLAITERLSIEMNEVLDSH